MKINKWIIVFCAAFMLVSACSKKDSDDKKEQAPNKEEKQESAGQFPLTGIESEQAATQRAIAVTINNHPAARPQSGLSQADIVYEMLAEGSVTRFLAIYQSVKPEKVGPVRSARKYFIDLAKGYDSLYIAHGYSPDAKEKLESGTIDHINGIQHDGTLFERVSFRKAPHNSYITFDNIEKGAADAHYEMDEPPVPMAFLKKDEVEKLEGERVSGMTISYSKDAGFSSEFAYDAEQEKYKRATGGEQTVEYETNEPVLLDNVIVIEAAHHVADEKGRKDIDLESGGKAFVLQHGIKKEAEWKNVDGRIVPYEHGRPLKLVPGKTWISIVPEMAIVSFGEK
ncbi:DUF3048 domain-containing protein [Siminovitchia sp. 179-K 8D1 HS]|uniref:DUF3048 domain-containing protein n=1 Tax=Siminovitchia sp. 179-K 8D1 HS TaxID=3142385 RepID=UPI0039A280E5